MINGADDADDDSRRTHLRLSQEAVLPAENWDDDFEFQPRATERVQGGEYDATNAPERPMRSHDQEESWDDAYEDEDPDASPIKRAPKVEDDDVEDWDSSDNEAHDEHEHEHENDLDHEPAREFGAGFEEEDKTVTARSTSSRVHAPPPPLPIPSLPAPSQHSQHPPPSFAFHPSSLPNQHPLPSTSPTLSSFSIPISSNRASIYSQDPLMPTASNSSAPHITLSAMRAYPQSAGSTPPRKGRRLRKKSRPPEADIFELEDREPDPLPIPESPGSPPAPPSPPRPVTPPATNTPAPQPTPSPSLLTRIGSLKRWARRSIGPDDPAVSGLRRKKGSTGPSESIRVGKYSTGPEELAFADESLEMDPRAVSPTPASGKARLRRSRGNSASGQKAGWFFRAGGGGGAEKDEVSTPALLSTPAPAPVRTPDPSPSKRGGARGLRRRERDEEGNEGTPTPKRIRGGKLVPALRTGGSGSAFQSQTRLEPASPTKQSRDPMPPRHGPRPISLQPQSQPQRSMQFPHHNGSASVGRSAGAPLSVMVTDAKTPPRDENGAAEGREREGGMRGLMNGVRRLSLVGSAHKRTKSTGGDAGAAEIARKGARADGAGRPRSRTDDRPVSRASANGTVPRPVSRASTSGTGKERHILLPPVELNSPQSSQFARRGSLPWADYDPVSDAARSPTSPASVEAPMRNADASSSSPSHPPSTFSPASKPHRVERQSFSASATSLLTGSPTAAAPSAVAPRAPVTPPRSGILTQSRPADPTWSQATALPPSIVRPSSSSPHTGSTSTIPSAAQSASLGRSTASPSHAGPGLRRNSLGDLKQTPSRGELKIPARISRAQQGLRRDLGMVREFAGCVEQLKQLQGTYTSLISDLRAAYAASPVSSSSRPISPAQVQFHLPSRPPSQAGTTRKTVIVNPNPSLQSVHQTMSPTSTTQLYSAVSSRPSHDVGGELVRLEHEYGIWWECAELLVELGGGSVAVTASNPNLVTNSGSALATPSGEPFKELNVVEQLRGSAPGLHVASMSEPGSIFEHAVIESGTKGPPQASPPHPSQWRASTGRHDLSARQLRLLKDMLSTPDPASLAYAAGPYGYGSGYPQPHSYPYAVQEGEDGRPWAPWNPSTVTLPSEESSTDPHHSGKPYDRIPGAKTSQNGGKEKKRRVTRLGMLGLREILRGLKRNAVAEGRLDAAYPQVLPASESSASASNSAEDDHYNRRRSPWHQHDENHAAQFYPHDEDISTLDVPPTRSAPPKSPRRPSLASIFRLGQKSSKNWSKGKEQSSNGNGSSTTEDELEADAAGGATGEYSDWERMSRSDLDLTTTAIGSGTATVRGKRKSPLPNASSNPHLHPSHSTGNTNLSTPGRIPTASQTSLRDTIPSSGTPPQQQPSKLPLCIAEEGTIPTPNKPSSARLNKERTSSWSQTDPQPRPVSRSGKVAMTGTVRSAPPPDLSSMSDPKLALTPENIKPLLEYAKEVSLRLGECIGEVQTLLNANAWVKGM